MTALPKNILRLDISKQFLLIAQNCLAGRWILMLIAIFGFVCGELAWGINGYAAPETINSRTLSDIYQQAAGSPIRTTEDKRADATRKPVEFLQFAQVRPGMRVLDLATGNGYTTQLLALVVGNAGTVWAQGDHQRPAFIKRLADPPAEHCASDTPFRRPHTRCCAQTGFDHQHHELPQWQLPVDCPSCPVESAIIQSVEVWRTHHRDRPLHQDGH